MDDFSTFASLQTTKGTTKVQDSVAQLVEQYTFNVWVLGSNPSGITKGARDSAFSRLNSRKTAIRINF